AHAGGARGRPRLLSQVSPVPRRGHAASVRRDARMGGVAGARHALLLREHLRGPRHRSRLSPPTSARDECRGAPGGDDARRGRATQPAHGAARVAPGGATAAARFLNPTHYGATFQLAAALDAAGRPSEARPVWEKMLAMAESHSDLQTAATVRAHLAGDGVASDAATMQAGLDALYRRHDPAEAIVQFRKILERNPTHYGATFQ